MNNEKIIAWAVMKDGECLSVRRFEPVASGEAEDVEFVPLVRFAEQPAQQEPVAWIDEYGNAFPLAAKQYSVVGKYWKPLYTSPPAKPSKPLTLGQKQRLWSSVGDKPTLKDRVNAYGTAIEAAHGIKRDA